MGGQAFVTAGPNGSPLAVPRMLPDVYQRVASEMRSKLVTVFRNVTIPYEGPGKQDFGDIDFLVEGSLCSWTPESIKELIGASYFIHNGDSNHYAVPYAETPDQFMQIDVAICPGNDGPDGPDLFEWTSFFKSCADLFQIIGICHRPLGVSCNNWGFHIRVKEIEPYNRKKSHLFLTRDPNQTLQFYGLDAATYWAGFSSEVEMFEWVANGRFFSTERFAVREETSNDRTRQKKRPMYRRFVEDFMPLRPKAQPEKRSWTREQVLDEALDMFDKRDEYESMIKEHNLREKELAIWQRIRSTLPVEGKSALILAVKSLRRWVNFNQGQPFITTEAMIEEQPLWAEAVNNEDLLLAWISEHWQEIRALEKERAVSRQAKARCLPTSSGDVDS